MLASSAPPSRPMRNALRVSEGRGGVEEGVYVRFGRRREVLLGFGYGGLISKLSSTSGSSLPEA